MGVTRPVSRAAQVAEYLRGEIERGEYQPGERLPSETVLAEQFEVTRPTVNTAMRTLAERGLVLMEHGRGTFVRERVDAGAVVAEALHRHETGLDNPVGDCPDPDSHERHVGAAGAVLSAMRSTGARADTG